MPWVTKFDQAAQDKMKDYEDLESKLIGYRYKILSAISDTEVYKKGINYVVEDTTGVVGEYVDKYILVRDDFFTSFDFINNELSSFCDDLNVAISECNSKKLEWKAKIYTEEWEEAKVCQKSK